MDNSKLIIAENLCKGFNTGKIRIDILKDAYFEVHSGETIAIVGASGIGKSTFLHIMGTLDYPDNGRLLFQGEDVFRLDKIKLAKFRNEFIGFVFQFHHLLPEFSAIENSMMPALIKGLTKHNAKEMAEVILVRVGLKDRLNHRVTELSGGEQQRVALARALVLKPVVLLADEPTGNLDKKNGQQVHELLMELNKELNMTLIVVTHNPELAGYMKKRVTITDGQVIEV